MPLMKTISVRTYEKLGGIHNRSPLGLTTEKLWYAHDSGRLGVVLLDNVDHDWSFVALAFDPRKGMGFRCYDVAASFATPDEAQAALAIALSQEPDPVFYTELV